MYPECICILNYITSNGDNNRNVSIQCHLGKKFLEILAGILYYPERSVDAHGLTHVYQQDVGVSHEILHSSSYHSNGFSTFTTKINRKPPKHQKKKTFCCIFLGNKQQKREWGSWGLIERAVKWEDCRMGSDMYWVPARKGLQRKWDENLWGGNSGKVRDTLSGDGMKDGWSRNRNYR